MFLRMDARKMALRIGVIALAVVEQRNKMVLGDEIEVFGPGHNGFTQTITEMYDEEGEAIEAAPHPQQILKMRMQQPVDTDWMLRRKQD